MTATDGCGPRHGIRNSFVRAVLMVVAVLTGAMFGQQDRSTRLPQVCEGSLLYCSPVSGAYEPVPLVHTEAAFDVRGLLAAATVTQQYENSTSSPIEAVYVFPLPPRGALRLRSPVNLTGRPFRRF